MNCLHGFESIHNKNMDESFLISNTEKTLKKLVTFLSHPQPYSSTTLILIANPMSALDNLPFELIEELKVKNLLPFVIGEDSSCNHIKLVVYENQKYCRVIKEWGSVLGVHLFYKVDRGVWSNEDGRFSLRFVSFFFFLLVIQYINGIFSCVLTEVPPLNGFKWEGEWTLVVEKGITDENGLVSYKLSISLF